MNPNEEHHEYLKGRGLFLQGIAEVAAAITTIEQTQATAATMATMAGTLQNTFRSAADIVCSTTAGYEKRAEAAKAVADIAQARLAGSAPQSRQQTEQPEATQKRPPTLVRREVGGRGGFGDRS